MKYFNKCEYRGASLRVSLGGAFVGLCLLLGGGVAGAGTLEDVLSRGYVRCGVTQGLPGFSNPDESGDWSGLDVDLCRGVAAAVTGDADDARFTPLSSKERFTALQSGEVDVLARVTTWTLVRDTSLGLNFAGVNYYDGQGFMVPRSLGVKSAFDLSGATVCANIGTSTELNMADFFRSNNLEYNPLTFEKSDEVLAAYAAGRCDVYTSDQSGLTVQRSRLKNPDAHVILPEVISKEPLGPVVRHGDDRWFDVVKWSLYCAIGAEELGLTSSNVRKMRRRSKNPEIKRMLGVESEVGSNLGLEDDWCYQLIRQTGNYGESFERNLGANTPMRLQRGVNAQWRDGGLMYAMPIR